MLFSKWLLMFLFILPVVVQAHRAPSTRVKSDADWILSALMLYEAEQGSLPAAHELTGVLEKEGIRRLNDPWGTPYQFHIDYDGDGQIVCGLHVTDQIIVHSAGGDQLFETEDDVFSQEYSGYKLKPSPLGHRVMEKSTHLAAAVPFILLIIGGLVIWSMAIFFALSRKKTRGRWLLFIFAIISLLIIASTISIEGHT